ncbi:cytochrome P450 [Blastococcus haudaquaticus]|uniref:Cytochrome P450 n=1 Tax=Blastococcus haudaquaticus TaxID=1938745 RepID=A0A286GRY6_9ACTN|nr:cytochrome P450 [Blastococcus haudaquaticus]SOD98331.1 Cytochrome P450 [Blastococcus haudaquaticus]
MSGEARPQPDWDPIGPGVERDPTEEHARLRRECPVPYADRFGGFWTLTRHEDVVAAARDTDTFLSSRKATIPDSAAARPARPPLEADPPEHTFYRQLLNPFFAPRRIRAIEPVMRQLAGELIESLADDGEADVVARFANPYPAGVLCAFLGLPREDWSDLKDWAGEVLSAARVGDTAAQEEANRRIYDYVARIVADRQACPGDPGSDLVTGLLVAQAGGDGLTADGVTGVVRLMLQAGHGTTTNAVGSAFRRLAEHPGEQERLRADPASIPRYLEEVLRMWTPARLLARTASRDTVVGGRAIRAGDKVALMWASANRDEAAFPEPEGFRTDRRPNRHVAFGSGIHFCLGAPLARAELRVAVEELLARTSRVEPAGPVVMARWPHIGPESLPLRVVR